MQRKPGFPVANCCIKMPDSIGIPETGAYEDDNEQQLRRQQLINFGHAQWGFNNWNWAVTKQELDFVDHTNGKYCAGVVAFVSVQVKSFDIHRENIGYATSNASNKGFAIYKSRKCAVTNALRETLLSFGGTVATELMELLSRTEAKSPLRRPRPRPRLSPTPAPESNQNLANRPAEPKNSVNVLANKRQDSDSIASAQNMRPAPVKNAPAANTPREPPVARAHPMPANLPPAANRPPAHVPPTPRPPAPPAPQPPAARPNSNDGRLEGMTEEEARAERLRRQRLAQEEFRLKQIMKNGTDEGQELNKNPSTFERLLADIITQDVVIEETGDSAQAAAGADWQTRGSAPAATRPDWQTRDLAEVAVRPARETRDLAEVATRPNWETRGTVQAPARPDWQTRDLAEASVRPNWQTRGLVHARADGKRKTPPPEGNSAKKRASASKLDIVQTD